MNNLKERIMKVGDLVKIDDVYPKFEGKVGLIIEERKGRVDPLARRALELVNE